MTHHLIELYPIALALAACGLIPLVHCLQRREARERLERKKGQSIT
jgi:hypothetical protein